MIFDCFTYFNDDLITELRLNILNNYVDKFVIVEATTDHSGKKTKHFLDLWTIFIAFFTFLCSVAWVTRPERPKGPKVDIKQALEGPPT